MNKHSNSDLLSVGSKLKTKKSKSKNVSVIFDEKSRTEYLTGFQKRNKEKKKKYLEKQKDILHQEKVEKRREKRKILNEAVTLMIQSETEHSNISKSAKPSISSEIKFSDSSAVTTVLIEEL